MEIFKCLQCGQGNNNSSNRIIQDSCGHYKCRSCILNDAFVCSTCEKLRQQQNKQDDKTAEPISVIRTPLKEGDTTEEQTKNNSIDELEKKQVICIFNEAVDFSTIKDMKLPPDSFENTEMVKENPKKCNYKKTSIKKPRQLPSHITYSGHNEDLEYKCKCGSTFKYHRQISYHKYCNSERPFSCEKCPKKFVIKSHLKRHMCVHDGIKKFICDKCNASFYEKVKLITHTRIHTGTKTHICSQCKAAFFTSSGLKEHQVIHSNSRPHACKKCDAKFSHISNLKKHEARHSDQKFYCPTCNKKCHTKYHLKKHSKMCPASYECSECSRVFLAKVDRDRHMLVHSDFKKFQCNTCRTTFRRKDNVQRHIRNAHPEVDLKTDKSFTVLKEDKPKAHKKIVGALKVACHEIQKHSIESEICNEKPDLNDESHLNKLYTNIFVHKAHKNFIPVEHQQWNIGSLTVTSYNSHSQCSDNEKIDDLQNINSSFDKNQQVCHGGTDLDTTYDPSQKRISGRKAPKSDNKSTELNNSMDSDGNYSVGRRKSESFSKRDIIEANEQRQSVIFNINKGPRRNGDGSVSQKIPSSHHPVPIPPKTVGKSYSNAINRDKFFSNIRESIYSYKSLHNFPTNIPCVMKDMIEAKMNSDSSLDKKSNEDLPKPIYLHKKVNYDRKTNQSKISIQVHTSTDKSNGNSTMCPPIEKKTQLNAELSELYKKILFSSYKGNRSLDKLNAGKKNNDQSEISDNINNPSLMMQSGSQLSEEEAVSGQTFVQKWIENNQKNFRRGSVGQSLEQET